MTTATSTAVIPKQFFLTHEIIGTPARTLINTDDMMHRSIVDHSSKSLLIVSTPTADFAQKVDDYYGKLVEQISTLKKFSCWQRKYIDFQATYTAFLLGALTEEEFEADSEQYASNFREIAAKDLVQQIRMLSNVVDFPLRTMELAEFFETEPKVVDEAMALLTLEDSTSNILGSRASSLVIR